MISVLKEFFKKNASKDTEESKEEKLQQACAALLIEVMRADYEQNEEETEKISALLQNTFKLSDAQLKKLMTFSEQAGHKHCRSARYVCNLPLNLLISSPICTVTKLAC